MPDSSQVNFLLVGETRNAAVSFDAWLGLYETLVGTPTVTGYPSGLTITNAQVNTQVVEVNGLDVPVGNAVLFTVTGGTSCTDYIITVTVTTNSSPAQTLIGKVRLQVYAE